MDLNIDFNNLDLENLGAWPLPVKFGVIVLLSISTLAAGYYFDTKSQLAVLDKTEKKESTLKSTFETKQLKAANLEAYKQQMVEMEESFGTMLRQLPSKTEVADLLVDITQTGLSSGLEFELFQPSNEIPREFYAELPITVRVTGTYHQFGEFVSGIAALPRIVTLHDIEVSPANSTDRASLLKMNAIAKTYRYLDESELGK